MSKYLGVHAGIPVIECDAIRSDENGYWILSFTCPYCGQVHKNGGGNGIEPIGIRRSAHCDERKEIIQRVGVQVQSAYGMMTAF